MTRVVLISPFVAERTALQQLLTDDGYEVAAAATREDGLDLAVRDHPDVLIADAQVAGLDGLALILALTERDVHPRVLLLCPRARRRFEKGRVVCLPKPIDLDLLRRYLDETELTESQVA
ncbi:MAG: response regulator [Acidobacteriota bacterium]